MADTLETAVAEIKTKIAEQVSALQAEERWREILRLHSGLNALEDICKMQRTDLPTMLGVGVGDGPKIGKYEFAGLYPLDAAKQYLRKIAPQQKAASLDEILAALESGNLKANRDELRISLSRSTTEIYKTGEDVYGLVENFPHIKRGTPGRRKNTSSSNTSSQSGLDEPEVPDAVLHKEGPQ